MGFKKLHISLQSLILKFFRNKRGKGNIVGGDNNRSSWCIWGLNSCRGWDVHEEWWNHRDVLVISGVEGLGFIRIFGKKYVEDEVRKG